MPLLPEYLSKSHHLEDFPWKYPADDDSSSSSFQQILPDKTQQLKDTVQHRGESREVKPTATRMVAIRLLNRLLSAAIRSCALSEIANAKTGEVMVALEFFLVEAGMLVEIAGGDIPRAAVFFFRACRWRWGLSVGGEDVQWGEIGKEAVFQ